MRHARSASMQTGYRWRGKLASRNPLQLQTPAHLLVQVRARSFCFETTQHGFDVIYRSRLCFLLSPKTMGRTVSPRRRPLRLPRTLRSPHLRCAGAMRDDSEYTNEEFSYV